MFICIHFNALPIEQNYVLCRFGVDFQFTVGEVCGPFIPRIHQQTAFKKNEFMNDIPEQNKHRKLNPFSI